MLKKIKQDNNYVYSNFNIINPILDEIDFYLAIILIRISLLFKITANKFDFISTILFLFLAFLSYYSENNILHIIIYMSFLTMHSWDLADGQIARTNDDVSFIGQAVDDTAYTLNITSAYMLLTLSITKIVDLSMLPVLLLFVYMRHLRIKDYFYRILVGKIVSIENEPKSSIEGYTFLRKLIDYLKTNDYRIIVLSLFISRFTIYNLNFFLFFLLFITQIARVLKDILWAKNLQF